MWWLVIGCVDPAAKDEASALVEDSSDTEGSSDSAESDTGESDTGGSDTGESVDSTDTNDDSEPDPDPLVADIVVGVHPTVATVLEVDWTQLVAADSAWLEFRVDDEPWMSSPAVARGVGAQHEVVLGTPASADVHIRIGCEMGVETVYSEEFIGVTGPLPAALVVPTLVSFDPTRASSDRWVLGSIDVSEYPYEGPFWVFLMDRQGRYVWYYEVPDHRLALYANVASDGRSIWSDGSTSYVLDTSIDPLITRLSLDGAYFETIQIDDYRFAVDEADDGAILYEWAHNGLRSIVERQPDGAEREIWSCSDYMTERGFDSNACNANTLVYDATRDSILYSMFGNDTVIEVDRASGTVLKQFGQLPGGWAFDPPEDVVDYQHYVNWTPTGTLIASTHVLADRGVQRTHEYEVDDAATTLHTMWTFGEEVDYYAEYAGEAQRLPNLNTLIGYGTGGALVEVTYDHEVVWDVTWSHRSGTSLIGHMTLVDDLYALNRGPE